MGETKEFPKIADWLRHLDAYPNATLFGNTRKHTARDLATELRALLADRDAWKAKAEARPEAPGRRLRAYKGVTYRDGAWYTPDGKRYEMASGVVWNKSVTLSLTDLDIPALLALRDDPYEPVETLEDVVREWFKEWVCSTAVASGVADLCTRLRTWLAQQPTPALTAAQHVAALVGMGAKERRSVTALCLSNGLNVAVTGPADVLILPPEATP